jgi:adenylate kinase
MPTAKDMTHQKDQEEGLSKALPKLRTLLIFGPPGAGKGTMGHLLGRFDSVLHLSSGDIFRGLDPDSPGGQLFQKFATKGLLVPDEAVIQIWHYYVSELVEKGEFDPKKQWLLLDGIPRTVAQAKMLEQYIDVEQIILLESDESELIRRIQRRATIEGRKDDSDIEVLRTRFGVFQKETAPVLGHYPKECVVPINANQSPPEVFRDILIEVASYIT